jgi:hypothetical protein
MYKIKIHLSVAFFLITTFFNCLSIIKTDSSEKDQLKEELLSGGVKQIEAIRAIPTVQRQDLISYLPAILRSNSSSEETVNAILALYIDYGNKLESFHPSWKSDFEWVLENSKHDSAIVQVIQRVEKESDRSFFYAALERITHRSMKVRSVVYSYLASLKDDRVIPFILDLAFSEVPIERYYYLEALRYMNPNDDRLTANLPLLLYDASHAIRSECFSVIERYKLTDKYSNHLKQMAISDGNYEVRKYAILSIKDQNLKNMSYILKNTIQDTHHEVRDVTLDAISKFNVGYFAKNVSDAMEVEDKSHIRFKMVDTLLHLNNHGGGRGLAVALQHDPQENVRVHAAYAAGVLGAKKIIPELLESLVKDKSDPVKIQIARTFSVLKEKSTIPTVIDTIGNSQESVPLRLELVSALDSINEPAVMPLLFDLIESEPKEDLRSSLKGLLRRMLYQYHKPKFQTSLSSAYLTR